MPWYVLSVHHGPGHQSGHRDGKPYSNEEYHYCAEPVSKSDRREWFEHLTRDLEYPVGEMKPVRNLPKKIREEKIKEYRARVKSARAMLKELGDK